MDLIGGGIYLPTSTAIGDAMLLLRIAEDPKAVKANLDAIAAAQKQFEAKLDSLKKREDAVAEREAALSGGVKRLVKDRALLDDAWAEHAAGMDKLVDAAAEQKERDGEAARLRAALDERFRELDGREAGLDQRTASLNAINDAQVRRATELDAREARLRDRDGALTAQEEEFRAKAERVTSALRGA